MYVNCAHSRHPQNKNSVMRSCRLCCLILCCTLQYFLYFNPFPILLNLLYFISFQISSPLAFQWTENPSFPKKAFGVNLCRDVFASGIDTCMWAGIPPVSAKENQMEARKHVCNFLFVCLFQAVLVSQWKRWC